MEGWLSRSHSEPSSSLLAEWNSYASSSSQSQDTSSSMIPFDLESAVRSANDTVTGTFNVVSKGVRDIPGNFQSATSTLPSGKALVYFGLLLASGVFFIFIAFTLFLPVIVIFPQKFAISFTLGCGFIIGSFFALKGPKNQLAHMFSNERLPFTLGFLCSMVGTIYVSMVRHSYILSVAFSVVQNHYKIIRRDPISILLVAGLMILCDGHESYDMVPATGSAEMDLPYRILHVLSLGYYAISYFPGGSAGMRFLTSALTSRITRCFGS